MNHCPMIANRLEHENNEDLLREACAELSKRLRAGYDCPAETILAQYPTLASEADRAIDLIYTEFALREELGHEPTPEEYYERFPNLRPLLERQFRVHQMLCQAPGPGKVGANAATLPLPTRDRTPDHRPDPWSDEYDELEEIGRGGKGVVFKARQIHLNRPVALKMILAGDHAELDDRQRFRQEAERMAQLKHPNIVQIYAVGERNGLPFFTMEYAEGGSLGKRIGGKPAPQHRAAQWMEAIARGVDFAHQQKLIHRDLKPGNVVLAADDTPKVTDFGLAKALGTDTTRTRDGDLRGTPSYMAPEQATGKIDEIGIWTDVYGLGTILYELLTGKVPFRGATPQETLQRVVQVEPATPRSLNPEVDAELEAICLKCLEKKPAYRYGTAAELADDLGRWLRRERAIARPRSLATRVRRALRRHWVLTAAGLLFVSIGLSVPVVIDRFDPDRPLREIERELAAGTPVELIGETGPPRWWRWQTDDPQSNAYISPDGYFSISSWDPGLLELLPDPGHDAYRFTIEVRQDSTSHNGAKVGVYVLHQKHDVNEAKPVHSYSGLVFGELIVGVNAPRLLELTRERFQPLGEYFSHGHVKLEIPIVFPTDDERWRQLVVEVTPFELRAFWARDKSGATWASEYIGKVSYERMQKDDKGLRLDPIPGLPDVPRVYIPRSGVGLYVGRATASFRRGVVAPLNEVD